MTAAVIDPRVLEIREQVSLSVEFLRADVAGRKLDAKSREALRSKVSRALYDEFHTGLGAPGNDARGNGAQQRDPELEERYAARLPHRTVRSAGTLVEDQDGDRVITIDGVRVRVPAASVGKPDGRSVEFSVGSARPNFSPGFFTTFGSRGRIQKAPILRVYVSAGTEARMLCAWEAALGHLESAGLPYQAKAISRPGLMARRDGMVVYLDADAHSALAGLVDALACAQEPWETPVPLLTRRVGPGVAYAWEPRTERARPQLSFGQHRLTAVTEALFAHAENPTTSFADHAGEQLLAEGIDPSAAHRNTDSPEISLRETIK
ncbi:T3SS effector HopA1 family protein [Streptomyces sp. NPDC003720]|uniref:T3SS effector HopA1 family protein n=1 Tax=Streptomyces sp. NPDC003720 TaxID=3364684 RepID=UPI003692CD8A